MMNKKIVFSGIQPTGKLTIGHYLGVLKQWVILQNNFQCFFCIADLHYFTKGCPNSCSLRDNIFDVLSIILSVGVDYNKCVIFLQSTVSAHTELYWFLNCLVSMSNLNKMIQYKQYLKSNTFKKPNLGLYTYPILMASDILLYQAHYVPIGFDQIQHIELVQDIARYVNKLKNRKIFNIPNYLLSNYSKVMSLLNPEIKMSKSDINKNNYILISDSVESVNFKIKNTLTDSDKPPKILYDKSKKPGISNLLNILSGVTNIPIVNLEKQFIGFNYNQFKKVVAKEINSFLFLFKKKYLFFRQNKTLLQNILKQGLLKANKKAQRNLLIFKKYIGCNIF